ncbi:DEAD/DEAH box helicase [Ottowia pentelensis]|uniref:DEAD/DEAH box helicase n=1 Tax=Ottowia pentelensis TaxID=511108 RepID=A0ABV6PSC6_9BURK
MNSEQRAAWPPDPRLNQRSRDLAKDVETSIDLSEGLLEPLFSGSRRLSSVLSHDDLERLLGRHLLNGFRSLARSALGQAPSLTKDSLAAALILQHGADLFANKSLRDIVAKRIGINSPARWHAGKAAALSFARLAGFDESFAGSPAGRTPDDVEWFNGRTALPALTDFQHEVLEKCQSSLAPGRKHPRVIATLPTGGGKTRVASEYVTRYLSRPQTGAVRPVVLWIAHTEELLEQAVEALRQVWSETSGAPVLRLDRRFGQFGRGDGVDDELLGAHDDPQILVATPQRLENDFKRWQQTFGQTFESWCDRIDLMVIDEAHRAAAPQYRRLIEYFESRSRMHERPEPRVLGLTATPFRAEYLRSIPELGTRELFTLFRRIVEPNESLGENPREVLQTRQVLANPIEVKFETRKNLRVSDLLAPKSELSETTLLESIDRRLMQLADDAPRRSTVFKELLKIAREPNSRILYFGPSVTDASIVAFMLRAQGIPAAFISGSSRRSERRRIVSEFRDGVTRVLCNCEVLTTGFDAPLVTHVVIARPTVSHVLFEQMVGRGLRGPKFGGTEICHVIYFVDRLDIEFPRLGFRAWRAIWGLEEVAECANPDISPPIF